MAIRTERFRLRFVKICKKVIQFPVEAIQIATSNGAKFLGEGDRIGTIALGKQADLVVINGNPADKISDIRNVELVFKDGAAYDPAKLLNSVRHEAGLR